MPTVNCPSCHGQIDVESKDAYFRSRIVCTECGTRLEVINERPLRVEPSLSGRSQSWISEWLTHGTETPEMKRP